MDWRYNTIWYDLLDEDKFYQFNRKEDGFSLDRFIEAEYSILWHLNKSTILFPDLPKSNLLKSLELNWASLTDLNTICKYPILRRLELHYCTKLSSLSGLNDISESLQFLHINTANRLNDVTFLTKLKELRVLCLNNVGEIDNLDFLLALPKLIDFRFVDTRITSGNLDPILIHPTVRSVGFLNKRHYNYRYEVMRSLLDEKFNDDIKEYVFRGKFSTFKYQGFIK